MAQSDLVQTLFEGDAGATGMRLWPARPASTRLCRNNSGPLRAPRTDLRSAAGGAACQPMPVSRGSNIAMPAHANLEPSPEVRSRGVPAQSGARGKVINGLSAFRFAGRACPMFMNLVVPEACFRCCVRPPDPRALAQHPRGRRWPRPCRRRREPLPQEQRPPPPDRLAGRLRRP